MQSSQECSYLAVSRANTPFQDKVENYSTDRQRHTNRHRFNGLLPKTTYTISHKKQLKAANLLLLWKINGFQCRFIVRFTNERHI